MHDEQPTYRAVCFDLDGTLLPMDIDDFMKAYFGRIGAFAAARGLDAERFLAALKTGVGAMAESDDARTNKEVFWEAFEEAYGRDALAGVDVEALCNEFYEEDFARVGDGVEPNPNARRAVEALRSKGYPLVLATMPFFPRRAVEHRLAWAGVDPAAFGRITTYDNSTSAKPRQAYYAENLAAMGLSGEEVLMVGNNTVEDLAFARLGADVFLVTDYLLDPAGIDLDAVRHGTMAAFADWACALPPCENPAPAIEPGLVGGV